MTWNSENFLLLHCGYGTEGPSVRSATENVESRLPTQKQIGLAKQIPKRAEIYFFE
jgi:hypothetical protein